ncbi:hypothetical protein [Thermococcus aciditolerans]|uniref:Uncharacterized protein n=1 Tax=Thermococcus aciditolerans TaxID=2598455 RepID=A0A5C0SLY7_9EURY|nr:hypothetical protein [Thermococcus aciditolerans]QEK15445.1 hypothetical protein FPV09_10505 [Thermococcus aciditolerans]
MEKRMISLTFLILLLSVSFVLAGDPQTPPQQSFQALNNEIAECEANLSLLQQQLQELNQTLENVTRERDYYRTLYENMTVNVTNLELIQIKQNITILNQQIQQLNVSISTLERKTENILLKMWHLELGFGALVSVTLIETFVKVANEYKKRKEKKDEKPKASQSGENVAKKENKNEGDRKEE